MANLVTERPSGGGAPALIDGDYSVDFSLPLPLSGGGQQAYAARSARSGAGFMAVQVEMGWPVRSRLLTSLAAVPILNVLTPLAHGPATMPSGDVGYFVISQAAPGRPLSHDLRPWPEWDLLELVLRPVALALSELHGRDVTHRAIRLNNLFREGAADPVALGVAWAAPPARGQSCVHEPPYSAICLPAGRGDGVGADDVYALGVALVTLALGRDPMEGMDDDAILRRKLEVGSFEAIVGRHRVPTAIAELARGMLADDPEHRPSAVLLGDPAAARARRAAARPQRRGQRSFQLGDSAAWTTRELAHGVMARPDLATPQLRTGAISLWLRRGLGDAAMASRIEDICGMRNEASHSEEPRADALLAMRAVAVLDPLAPLSWRRLSAWPSGLGAALNQASLSDPAQAAAITEIITNEVALAFGHVRPERTDIAALQVAARQVRTWVGQRPAEQAMLRLNYALNPLAPCESPLLAGRWVARLIDLLPGLEVAAAGPLRATLPPVDRHIVSFISMRKDDRAPADIGQFANVATPGDPMSQLRLLARLQQYAHPEKLPALTAWMTELVTPVAGKFHSQSRREKLAERLAELSKGGLLPPLVALLDDPAKLELDAQGYEAAIARAAKIDIELEGIERSEESRQAASIKAAHNVTSGISLAACGLAIAAAGFL